MAPPSALPRLRGQTDSRFALESARQRGEPQNIYLSTDVAAAVLQSTELRWHFETLGVS
jgi:hypothetical protein